MPRPRIPLDRARDVALVLFLAYAAAANLLAYGDYRTEDAYITFRYAANLAAGDGFVFNPGERVLGTSTPLWTLLLAALAAAGLDIVAAAGFLYTLCLSLCGYFGALFLGRQGFPNAGAVFALAAVWGAGGSLLFIGMETTLYLTLIFLSLLVADRRPWAAGTLLGLVMTARYDGVVVAGVVLLVRWLSTKKLPWREAATCGGLFAGWLLFAQLYFGSPLPNTLGAKIGDVGVLGYLGGSLLRQARFLFTPLLRFGVPIHLGIRLLATVVLLLPAALLARRLLRPDRRLWALPAIAVLLWLGYGLIGPPLDHPWYLTPAAYCFLALCLAAWGELLKRWRGERLAAAAVLAAIAASTLALPVTVRRESRRLTTSPNYQARQGAYDLFVTWMRDHGLAGATLFTYEPGYLTYQTRQPVIDGAGLVTRDLFFHGPKERRTSLAHIVATRQPDLMILRSTTGRLRRPEIAGDYLPVYQAQPRWLLLLRRSVFELHFDRLFASWSGGYHPGPEPAVRHPLAVDFETWPAPGMRSTAGKPFVGRPLADLRFEGRPVADRTLHTWSEDRGETRTLWSVPFLIDFDELVFRFAATDPRSTVAQLYVGGLLALEVGGTAGAERGEPLAMRRIVLPVHPFRGRVGVLRFVDVDRQGGFLAADRVASRRYVDPEVFDDFESGAYGERWQRPTAAPTPTRELALKHGLVLALGTHAATRLGLEGAGALVSRPFTVERDRMSFVVYDFGGPATRVELEVDGRVVRRFTGGDRRELVAVRWDLAPWRGRQAVLAVIDGDEDPERGIGVDSIVWFDRAAE